jgi:hypothetical protein
VVLSYSVTKFHPEEGQKKEVSVEEIADILRPYTGRNTAAAIAVHNRIYGKGER